MNNEENLVRIFTGPEITAVLLMSRLEEMGIYTLTKNDFSGAFLGVAPASIDLYIRESDLTKAEPVILEFTKEERS